MQILIDANEHLISIYFNTSVFEVTIVSFPVSFMLISCVTAAYLAQTTVVNQWKTNFPPFYACALKFLKSLQQSLTVG